MTTNQTFAEYLNNLYPNQIEYKLFKYENESKMDFLNSKKMSSAKVYYSFLKKFEKHENIVLKGISKFEKIDFENSYKLFNNISNSSISASFSAARAYLIFLEKDSGITAPGVSIRGSKSLNLKSIFTQKEQLLSLDDIRKVIRGSNNYQDSALFILLFEGVRGSNMTELINLKEKDIDFENKKLTLREQKKGMILIRDITVSDYCLQVLHELLQEYKYYVKKFGYFSLVSSEFVFKKNSRNAINLELKPINLYQRLDRLCTENGLGKTISPSRISISGMVYFAENYAKNHQLKYDDKKALAAVASQYDSNSLSAVRDILDLYL